MEREFKILLAVGSISAFASMMVGSFFPDHAPVICSLFVCAILFAMAVYIWVNRDKEDVMIIREDADHHYDSTKMKSDAWKYFALLGAASLVLEMMLIILIRPTGVMSIPAFIGLIGMFLILLNCRNKKYLSDREYPATSS